jgi:hypothetical protein
LKPLQLSATSLRHLVPPLGVHLAGAVLGLWVIAVPHSRAAPKAPIWVTNTGSLLSDQGAARSIIATPTGASDVPEAVGAVTLRSHGDLFSAAPNRSTAINNSRLPSSDSLFVAGIATESGTTLLDDAGSAQWTEALSPTETGLFQEVAAAPEPSSWLAGVCAFTLLAWQQRRRFCRAFVPPKSA